MIKVIPRIVGGLGNQLFCYSAARRLALTNNGELIIDHVSGFVRDHTYKRHYQLDHFEIPCRKALPAERLEPLSRVRRFLKRKWNQRLPFSQRSFIQQEGIDFDPRLLHVKPHGTVYLEGYWQSEDYFKDVEDTIRKDLNIKPPSDIVNQSMAAKISGCTAVAVHVRFFDEQQTPGINNVHSDYYTRAILEMECRVPNSHYFLFSDKPITARALIPLPDERMTIVSHNLGDEYAYADLWLMTQCQHFIIANSTFSWWGAWLAKYEEKLVIAPELILHDTTRVQTWNFPGHLPCQWILK